MKFAICNELFQGWDFRKIVRFTKEIGYHGLEIAPFTFADSVAEISPLKRREIKTIADDAGLEITGLHWLLAKPDGLHINHPNRAIRQRTVAYLHQLIDFAADIGGSIMVFGSPGQRLILPELSREDGWRLMAESLNACIEAAWARGVTICLEALPVNQTNLFNANQEILQMVNEINHPNIRMMLDVKSMCNEEVPIMENIKACSGYFHHVHANDANLRGPGFGKIDFRPILKTLNELDYHRYVSVEVFDYSPDPETIASKSLSYLKKCLAEVTPCH